MALFWCRTCGVVWASEGEAPLCRHYAPDLPATEMEPLPSHHPFAEAAG
ncbi:MAG TPA: hypothetical protein VFI17_08530 [Solirubrobacterales bacterium]|nr:hypothetical protein [Solirubrobacterales bacterium]